MNLSALNAITWRARDIVDEYARASDLQAPERAILGLLEDRLRRMRMLDLGVGGGRTTLHFAPRVSEYVGMDYSEEMIAACKKRFSVNEKKAAPLSFVVGDARAIDGFPASYFDFILFSFNGIDSISPRARARVFKEVLRVGSNGGLFFFSTHNLQTLHTFGDKFKSFSYVVINDGVHEERLHTYYIRPAFQVMRLRRYFADVIVYSLATGGPLPRNAPLDQIEDPWLYYLCAIEK